jgi:hypothetical protein
MLLSVIPVSYAEADKSDSQKLKNISTEAKTASVVFSSIIY